MSGRGIAPPSARGSELCAKVTHSGFSGDSASLSKTLLPSRAASATRAKAAVKRESLMNFEKPARKVGLSLHAQVAATGVFV
jgi:hypothetical protein